MPTPSEPSTAPAPFQVDAALHRALEARLRRDVRGEVRFDAASRALYATDSSNYRQVPIGVVCPRDADDAVAAVAACREFGAPVLSRGAGTPAPCRRRHQHTRAVRARTVEAGGRQPLPSRVALMMASMWAR